MNGFVKLELREEVGLGQPRTTYNLTFRNSTQKKPQLDCSKSSRSLNVYCSNGAVVIVAKAYSKNNVVVEVLLMALFNYIALASVVSSNIWPKIS